MPPVVDSSPIHHHQCADHHRLPSKRKLDEYADDDLSEELAAYFRMRKVETISSQNPPPLSSLPSTNSRNSCANSSDGGVLQSRSFANAEIEGPSSGESSSGTIQFFVKMISGGNTLVLRANWNTTVEEVHHMIESLTGIPAIEQRLIYRGKQLHCELTLAESSLEKDAGLQLVGRMRSTEHPRAWRVIHDMVSIICRICRNEITARSIDLSASLEPYITGIPKEVDPKVNFSSRVIEYLKVFVDSCAPKALVMLYLSHDEVNKASAASCIRKFVSAVSCLLRPPEKSYFATILLEFCRLLSSYKTDPMYLLCRGTLGTLIGSIDVVMEPKDLNNGKYSITLHEILPFLIETVDRLSKSAAPTGKANLPDGPLPEDVCDFSAFLPPLHKMVEELVMVAGPISIPSRKDKYKEGHHYSDEIEGLHCSDEVVLLHNFFCKLRDWVDATLKKYELYLEVNTATGKTDALISGSGWSHYLPVLKNLYWISSLYVGAEDQFWAMMKDRKAAFCALIVRYAKRLEDNSWLIEHKDVLNFESRRHLAMLMFPLMTEDYDELHEMLIDRSQLLAESFEYILHADVTSLHAGLFMEFKNEEATGPGVLREWFFLVSQEIFNPQNALFVACPHDRRRFFPNPASRVDPMHLEYFTFSGRIIALALMHKIQVGIVFDRVFLLQLAGKEIRLEDVKDADPYLYNSCKQILDMDADMVDSDALGLTFVSEIEELGSMKVVELCPDGVNMVVSSKNRDEYVRLLIRHRFVKSTAEQVAHFAHGFGDILDEGKFHMSFFRCLDLEDLDWLLSGSGDSISVEDWKAHTEYNGYKNSDPQIEWFWEAVGNLTANQKKTLLFFWTSIKFLPIEGFKGLASRLYIYKASNSQDRLPSSHTCFHRLCIPAYPSLAVMQDRLDVITQEHVGCGFGTW